MERMTIGLSHPIGHVAQGGLIAGGFCMPSGLGIVGAAAIERMLCCSGGQNLFQVFWDQEVHFFLGKLGSPLPLWHSLQYIYSLQKAKTYMGNPSSVGRSPKETLRKPCLLGAWGLTC